MGVTSVAGGQSIASLAQQLFDACDVNRDGQLTKVEFQDMLQALISAPSVNRTNTPSVVAPRSVSATTVAPPAMEGFEASKIPTRQSPKYMFARVAMQYALSDVHDKASAQALLTQMRPALEAEGMTILEVQNDRLKFSYEGQDQWVDVIRAAGSSNQAFQWLVT